MDVYVNGELYYASESHGRSDLGRMAIAKAICFLVHPEWNEAGSIPREHVVVHATAEQKRDALAVVQREMRHAEADGMI